MASVNKNTLIPGQAVVPTLVTKVTRGRPANLGSITLAGDVVNFTISEPTNLHQGFMIVQVGPGTLVLGAGTFALEFSIDAGVSWAVFPAASTTGIEFVYTLTGQPGADPAAIFAAQYNVGGHGSGSLFRFGFVVAPTSGSSPVFVLVG